ncbi:chitin synthase [Chytriomyces confervae]|uniref:Chitin synthase n=1 Tax=Chytriomyces confervae TaxID=246404 RepID=A0A507FJC2_9FUNG|nr:chitin synthase [Chytriomyces confervae]
MSQQQQGLPYQAYTRKHNNTNQQEFVEGSPAHGRGNAALQQPHPPSSPLDGSHITPQQQKYYQQFAQQQQQQQQYPPPPMMTPNIVAPLSTIVNFPPLQQAQEYAQQMINKVQDKVQEFTQQTLPRAQPKMTQQQVKLKDGNFIVNVPLSKEYLKHVEFKDGEEFTHLRYTAATTDPDNFCSKYKLRQTELGRKTRIAVVCTMYAEDDILFTKTMSAVQDNIAYLCSGASNGKGWGEDSWKQIVVVIVSDGRSKVNQRTLDVLSVMGCYMDGLPRASVNDEAVTGHFFEFTTQVRVSPRLVTRFGDDPAKEEKIVPCQTLFLLKEKNAKKINSHRWFFKAVCDGLDPEICILIDVGTKPTKQSFYHLYRAFERNPNVAGACGEIAAELGANWRNLLNPLVAVQNFEYKMSNILDKPLESVLGYISVLPGAFSAYRYQALQGEPLKMYFKGEKPHGTNVSEANMYLAEDRILCFELVMKASHQYVLKYVKSAKAETDVPSELHDLIKQRRRWLNGSFFASVHAIWHFTRIFSSGHTFVRKGMLLFETLYNAINLLFSWFNIGNMYLSFYFLFNIAENSELASCTQGITSAAGIDPFYPYGGAVSAVLRCIYISSFIAMVIASLGNRPEAIKTVHIVFVYVFAVIMAFMLFMGIWTIKSGIETYVKVHPEGLSGFFQYMSRVQNFRDLVVSGLSTYVLYVLSSILFLDPWHTVTCMLQYLVMIPSFANIVTVYAFCNIHDVSWGTKGITSAVVLPSVKATTNDKGETTATVELPAQAKDSDEYYSDALRKIDHEAAHLLDRKDGSGGDDTTDDDFFKQFRTFVVVFWFFSNFLLVFIFTNPWINGKITTAGDINPYLGFLLWSVAALSLVRFVFSTIYLMQWGVEYMQDR